jgi:glycosyltransferase involved in cell wall biosynthesis
MDLSVLITNHNYDCSKLLLELESLLNTDFEYSWEIIVVDDCSTHNNILENNVDTSKSISHCLYHINEKNRGAAFCRNLLVKLSQGKWLVFIDGDASIGHNSNFIQNYWNNRFCCDVVVGGLIHPQLNNTDGISLRYRYEKAADKHRSAEARSLEPYEKFTAFNIMANKDIFNCISFDETCTEYGYEDALFGIELMEKGISIKHIENPLIHCGLDSNESFLNKTEVSLLTLLKLQSKGKMKIGSKVSRAAHKLEKFKLHNLYIGLFNIFKTVIRRNLLSNTPSLLLFSIYKLGVYLNKKHLS